MALTYGFYNSIDGDRVYDAIQFGRIFDGIIKDGVYATYEKGMMVIASSNPAEVIIQPGRAWFNHTWSYNDANVIFEAPAPEVLLERIDALVLEINEELSSRENSYKWVTGTPSSRPERPTLTNTSTIHQYPLCYVHRYPETTMIYTRDITNAIGTSECPFATGVLEGIDLDAWINQWDDEFHTWESTTKTGFETWMLNQEQVYTAWFDSMHSQMDTDLAEFEAWFQTIQGIIDKDAALHLQQEIDELRQEATSGSRIFVHTINQSLFGKNVTITEAGGTVFTSRFDNTGVAEFKSIPYVGNLTISSTDGVQTATSVVNTPYYARYNFTIAFWAATVNIVGDPEMSGSTVTVRDSNEVLVGTVVLDSEGTGIFTATAPDTYKFILTYGGQTMEVTLSVTQETTYTVDLHANRFKWQDWLEAGGVTGSYSSLDDVLEDEVALRRLFTVHASVDYMTGINKENEDVETIINNDFAAKWINNRDYALDTLYANTIIKGYMDTADKYGYGEWALVGQVPKMTSNTAPYGTAIRSSIYDSDIYNDAYKAFDNSTTSAWCANSASNEYVGYTFTSAVCITSVEFDVLGNNDGYRVKNYKIQASNDGFVSDIHDLYTGLQENTGNTHTVVRVSFANSSAYTSYRLFVIDTYAGNLSYPAVWSLQFYAWQPKGNVPVMTSATTPYGEATGSTQVSGCEAYKAFGGSIVLANYWQANTSSARIKYKFTNPVCVKAYRAAQLPASQRTLSLTLQGSNDDSTWENIEDSSASLAPSNYNVVTKVTNDKYYLYYKVNCSSTDSYCVLAWLQFYGRELSVSVPVMTGYTTPYGEASASTEINSTYAAWKAFTPSGNIWYPNKYASNMIGEYIQYDFIDKIVLRGVYSIWGHDAGTDIQNTWTVLGSNDNFVSDVNEIQDITIDVSPYIKLHNISNDTPYKSYRLRCKTNPQTSGSNHFGLRLQFYGLDYSEKEFEEGTTKKWLYDHGVELETMEVIRGSVTKNADNIRTAAANGTAATCGAMVDLTAYELLRQKIDYWDGANANDLMVITSTTDLTTLGFVHSTSSNAPYTIALDISSIDQTALVAIQSYYPSAQVAGIMDTTELWLE